MMQDDISLKAKTWLTTFRVIFHYYNAQTYLFQLQAYNNTYNFKVHPNKNNKLFYENFQIIKYCIFEVYKYCDIYELQRNKIIHKENTDFIA